MTRAPSRFGEFHPRVPCGFAARGAADQYHDIFGGPQQLRGFGDCGAIRHTRDRRHEARGVDRRNRLRKRGLLHFRIEVHIDRPLRCRVRDPCGAHQGLACRSGGGRLVVPLDVGAHQRALIARGVDPVDPGAALGGIDRPGRAEHQHRHAIAPRIEDRHGGVHQPDIGMHRRRHRLAGHLGVAVRDCDRALLVQAEQHLRRGIAEVIDEAVVQAAIARAGIERDVGNVERAQRVGDDVRAERRRVCAGWRGTLDG